MINTTEEAINLLEEFLIPQMENNSVEATQHWTDTMNAMVFAIEILKKEQREKQQELPRFTKDEIELLSMCLSKHFYSISGFPANVLSCAMKLEDYKERLDFYDKG